MGCLGERQALVNAVCTGLGMADGVASGCASSGFGSLGAASTTVAAWWLNARWIGVGCLPGLLLGFVFILMEADLERVEAFLWVDEFMELESAVLMCLWRVALYPVRTLCGVRDRSMGERHPVSSLSPFWFLP